MSVIVKKERAVEVVRSYEGGSAVLSLHRSRENIGGGQRFRGEGVERIRGAVWEGYHAFVKRLRSDR